MSAQPGGETAATAPGKTPETESARAQRLDHLLTPISPPEATVPTGGKVAPTSEKKATAEPKATEEPERTGKEIGPGDKTTATPTGSGPNIADLVPENPQTNDQVLLQDIYEKIDLEQFTLDLDESIPQPDDPLRESRMLVSLMRYPGVHQHPYLHLFPELKHMASQSERDIGYFPFANANRETFDRRDPFDLAASHNSLTYFIYNPWFEQVHYWDANGQVRCGIWDNPPKDLRLQDGDPYWFGNNSTRGVLAETVAKLLEDAKLPSADPYPRSWFTQIETRDGFMRIDPSRYSTIKGQKFAPRDRTLEEYIRIGVEYPGPRSDDFDDELVELHSVPQVTWEFLHPQLPILRITAHAEQRLPLLVQNTETVKPRKVTRYSVSFVISLQNRWTSFDEPNRWIVRFGEDLELYMFEPHFVDRGQGRNPNHMPDHWEGIDPKKYRGIIDAITYPQEPGLTYPDYWDDTDYMQHRIIGPVVLTVHESPALRPGTYSRIPRISHWEAPGHVLTEEQVQTIPAGRAPAREYFPDSGEDSKRIFRVWPHTQWPNTGFPLPGHVMVTPQYGPGTWKKYGMESWEEYDVGLAER